VRQWLVIGSALALVAVGIAAAVLDSWSAGGWAALAAWITAAVAGAAGYVALGQLDEARASRREQARLRREQAQPYVVASIEASEASSVLIKLVVRNFGATAAHDVRLDVTPTPTRGIDKGEQPEYLWLPQRFPVLVPGQEWRTLWDSGIARADTELPDHHTAVITYSDSQGERYTTEAVLDWRMVKDREAVVIYGAHHAGQALREISKTLGKWNDHATGGLSVYTRDGDARDQRAAERRAARQAATDEQSR
jgi:hypothetical protein